MGNLYANLLISLTRIIDFKALFIINRLIIYILYILLVNSIVDLRQVTYLIRLYVRF